ncbi:hypothetical protein CO666_33460, partial [Rhizobium chutanense]
ERLEEEEKSMNGVMFRTVHRGSAIGEEDVKLQQGRRVSVPAANSGAMSPLVPSEVARALL